MVWSGVASPSQVISTDSAAAYPSTVTVEPTGPDAGDMPRPEVTEKASAARLPLAPAPSTLWTPAVAAGTVKVAVPLPAVDAVALATFVEAVSVSYHLTVIASPAA